MEQKDNYDDWDGSESIMLQRDPSIGIGEYERSGVLNNFTTELQCLDTRELMNEYFIKQRYRLFGLYNITTRTQAKRFTKNWYTTTCYLSGKINIMLFAMLCVFYTHKDNYTYGRRTEFITQWTMVENSLWELLITNSLNFRSEPATLAAYGQDPSQSLRSFEPGIEDMMRPIISVSNGGTLYAETIYPTDGGDHSPYNRIIDILRASYDTLNCKCLNMSIALAGIKSETGGVIHWFCFELYNNELFIISSWADGDANIQSTIQRQKIEPTVLNQIVNTLYTHDGVLSIIPELQKYFFLNPINSNGITVDPGDYLIDTFEGTEVNMRGKFEIIVYGDYLNKVIELTQYLYDTSITNETFQSKVRSDMSVYQSGIHLPQGMETFKLLIGEVFDRHTPIKTADRQSKIVTKSKRQSKYKHSKKIGGKHTKRIKRSLRVKRKISRRRPKH